MIPFFEKVGGLREYIKDTFGIRFEGWPLLVVGTVLLVFAYILIHDTVSLAISIALFLAPVWLSLLLVGGARFLWLILKRSEFIAAQKYMLLEVKPPRNLVKTPLAMETFFSSIHLSPGEANWYAKWIKGGVRPWWSLEIASFEGKVHFFIWTRSNFRRIIESQIYAQYPGTQIV